MERPDVDDVEKLLAGTCLDTTRNDETRCVPSREGGPLPPSTTGVALRSCRLSTLSLAFSRPLPHTLAPLLQRFGAGCAGQRGACAG